MGIIRLGPRAGKRSDPSLHHRDLAKSCSSGLPSPCRSSRIRPSCMTSARLQATCSNLGLAFKRRPITAIICRRRKQEDSIRNPGRREVSSRHCMAGAAAVLPLRLISRPYRCIPKINSWASSGPDPFLDCGCSSGPQDGPIPCAQNAAVLVLAPQSLAACQGHVCLTCLRLASGQRPG